MKLIELHALRGDLFTYTPEQPVAFTITRPGQKGPEATDIVAERGRPLIAKPGDVVTVPGNCDAFDGLVALGQAREIEPGPQPAEESK